MNAVVVTRAQVQRGKTAIFKQRRQRGVTAHHGSGRIAVAFGLKNLVLCNGTKLADGTIDRADQVSVGQRPCAGLERTREKVIEAAVTADVRVQRLIHVDLVLGDKPANDFGGDPATFAGRDPARKSGQCLLGKKVLGQDGAALRCKHEVQT